MLRTVGTPAFFAPEMCEGRPFSARGADLWALGVCLYIFLFGAHSHPLPRGCIRLHLLYTLHWQTGHHCCLSKPFCCSCGACMHTFKALLSALTG